MLGEDRFMKQAAQVALGALVLMLSLAAHAQDEDTYDQNTVVEEAEAFFGEGAKGLGKVIEKVFEEHGRPNAFIKGEEVGGAIGVGVRYGKGTLVFKRGGTRSLYWQGPSVGFDLGGNAAKVFALVYNLPDSGTIFQRFPGVEGSLYFVGGVGVNYVQSGSVIVAPMRFGVGWRQGVSVGYMHFTRKKSWNPF
jgi:hypothetical protein